MKKIKIGNLCKINQHNYSSKMNWNSFNYLDTGSLTENNIDGFQHFDAASDLPSRAKRLVKEHSILFSTVRPNQNHFGIIESERMPNNLLVSTGFAVLDVLPEYDPFYVYYALTFEDNVERLQNIAEQSVTSYPSISPQDIEDIEILIPDTKEEQERAASVLKHIDEKIRLNKKINSELLSLARSIYEMYFLQFDYPVNQKPYKTSGGALKKCEETALDYPSDWSEEKLSTMIKEVTTGLNPRDNFVLTDSGYKYITVKNLTADGFLDYKGCDFVDEAAARIIRERSNIEVGCILFSSIAPLGRCYFVDEYPSNWEINESVFCIKPKHDYLSYYLYMLFTSEYFIERAENSSTGSVFSGIRISTLMDMVFLLPSKSVLELFNDNVADIFKKMSFIHKENEQLLSLKSELFPLVIKGQVVQKGGK